MKKGLIGISLLLLWGSLSAQNAIDAYNVTQDDMRGTARYMSMAGAFGALGGDLSTLNQNPAGIGVYRSSEIGITVDFDIQSTSTPGYSSNMTKVYCNNFGYVGSVNLNGDLLKTFNWGATYNRKASFDRDYLGGFGNMPSSLTNYIANEVSSIGVSPSDLSEWGSTNPYDQQGLYYPYWLGVLAYNSGLISPMRGTSYTGLASQDSRIDGYYNVSERGYIDEYSINFGGNFLDMVYWGIGFGITDLRFTQWASYGEDITNANVPLPGSREVGFAGAAYTPGGTAGYDLNNYKKISGSGFNVKLGVIVKPVEEFRLGFAVHTPTWYSLNHTGDAYVSFDYSSGFAGYYDGNYDELDYPSYLQYSLRTPWKLMFSAAGVIGGRFIISGDYVRDAYNDMSFSGEGMYNTDYKYINEDIKYYYQGSNTFRIGAEYRVSPQFSVRAGYSNRGDNVKQDVFNPTWQATEGIYTSGAYDEDTNTSFAFNKKTQFITFGLGYKFRAFYVDAAFAYRMRNSIYQPFTSWFDGNGQLSATPSAEIKQRDSNIVLSVGYKF